MINIYEWKCLKKDLTNNKKIQWLRNDIHMEQSKSNT